MDSKEIRIQKALVENNLYSTQCSGNHKEWKDDYHKQVMDMVGKKQTPTLNKSSRCHIGQ